MQSKNLLLFVNILSPSNAHLFPCFSHRPQMLLSLLIKDDIFSFQTHNEPMTLSPSHLQLDLVVVAAVIDFS